MTSLDSSLDQVLADRYRLHGLLGQGGMSDVFRAEDLFTRRMVALKIVRSGDPRLTRRLVQEASALERLDHPGLVRLLDTGMIGERAYLAMELVDGPTLAETLGRGPLTPGRAARVGRTVAEALSYVHEAGIVHRDVKPANVMFDGRGEVRLGDFGIARLIDASTLTAEGTTLGTAAYMAPEQLEDHEVGPPADLWSLGIVLLESLTGRRVFDGTPGEVLARRTSGEVAIPDELPTPWRLLLAGMLDTRPSRRLRDREVAALLSTIAFEDAPAALADPAPVRGPRSDPSGPIGAALPVTAAGGAPTGAMPVPPELVVVRRPIRKRRVRRALLVVLLAGLVGTGAYALVSVESHPPAHRAAAGTSTHARSGAAAAVAPPPTTTASSSTTTSAPAGDAALATLESDVQSAVADGSVDAGTGSALVDRASAAVDAANQGDASSAAGDLQRGATTLAEAIVTGSASPAAGAQLEGDLAGVASALGVAPPVGPLDQAASTTTTTTTAPSPAPAQGGSGPGHHRGDG